MQHRRIRAGTQWRIVAAVVCSVGVVGVVGVGRLSATSPPRPPVDATASLTDGQVTLTWTDSSSDESGFEIERSRKAAGEWVEPTTTIVPGGTELHLDAPEVDGEYAYLIRSVNEAGPSAWARVLQVSVSSTTEPPDAPTDLRVSRTGRDIRLSWTDASSTETVFDILQARNVAGEWGEWAASAVDRDVSSAIRQVGPDGHYAFLVRARNAEGSSPWVVATIIVSDATATPANPTALAATATAKDTTVELSWGDPATDEHGFDIMRARKVGDSFTDWAAFAVDTDVTTFEDEVGRRGSYVYLVRATNPVGTSDWTLTSIGVGGAPSIDLTQPTTSATDETTATVTESAPFLDPSPVATEGRWTAASSGLGFTIAIADDGTLWGWGRNEVGQLGDGSTLDRSQPVQIDPNPGWTSVEAGDYHAVAVRTDGSMWTWGNNLSGQVGDGTKETRNLPTPIHMEHRWLHAAAGGAHTLAIRADGTLWGWGLDNQGQVGAGTTSDHTTPAQIGTDDDWASVTAGQLHTVAVRRDGTLWSWGDNSWQQLDGSMATSSRSTPARVGTESDWVSASTTRSVTTAQRADGSVWTWGQGSTPFPPARIGADEVWTAVSSGGSSSLAVRADGTLWSWGARDHSPADVTDEVSFILEQVGTDTDWASVAAGSDHVVGLDTDGILLAWTNAQTQLEESEAGSAGG